MTTRKPRGKRSSHELSRFDTLRHRQAHGFYCRAVGPRLHVSANGHSCTSHPVDRATHTTAVLEGNRHLLALPFGRLIRNRFASADNECFALSFSAGFPFP